MKGDEWVQGMTRRVLGYFSLFFNSNFLAISFPLLLSLFFFGYGRGYSVFLNRVLGGSPFLLFRVQSKWREFLRELMRGRMRRLFLSVFLVSSSVIL